MSEQLILAADKIAAPSISYWALLPMLILLGAATVGVLVEAFVPRSAPLIDVWSLSRSVLSSCDNPVSSAW